MYSVHCSLRVVTNDVSLWQEEDQALQAAAVSNIFLCNVHPEIEQTTDEGDGLFFFAIVFQDVTRRMYCYDSPAMCVYRSNTNKWLFCKQTYRLCAVFTSLNADYCNVLIYFHTLFPLFVSRRILKVRCVIHLFCREVVAGWFIHLCIVRNK